MVFKSQNKIRFCKWCDKRTKENIQIRKNGKIRRKGYYRTCGSKECTSAQYRDEEISRKKSFLNESRPHHCLCCNQLFQAYHGNHTKFCRGCVPDHKWRERARRYGIGKPQWEAMLEKQNGQCALCERNPEVIDHCHDSGRIRGLLCNKCNGNIKFLDMEKDFKEKAIIYTKVKDVSFQK